MRNALRKSPGGYVDGLQREKWKGTLRKGGPRDSQACESIQKEVALSSLATPISGLV